MSDVMTLGYFLAGFIIFLYGSNLVDTMVVCVFAIFSAIGLYIFGPNPFLFGMILSTGWCLLNVVIEKAFPIEN